MRNKGIPNYIRSHRKRHGLSQTDVAFLLSSSKGAKVSRYEHFKQQPSLETAIGLEILFRTPVRTLFSGTFDQTRNEIIHRAEKLALTLANERQSPDRLRRLEAIRTLLCELRDMRA